MVPIDAVQDRSAPSWRERTRTLRRWVMVLLIGGTLGFPIAHWAGVSLPISIVFGSCIGGLCLAFKHRLLLSGLRTRISRLPRGVGLPAFYLTHCGLIIVGIALAHIINATTGLDVDDGSPNIDFFQVFSYSAASVVLLLLLDQTRSLIGNPVFFALITGRYSRPVEEQRLFLQVDMANSTALAARLGDREAMRVVGRFLYALGEPVRCHGGVIDKYVGDQAIISWRLTPKQPQAPALSCALAIRRALTGLDREMAVGLGFRIAIHAGPVIVAQVGDERKEITYFGDTINSLARLDGVAKDLGRDIILTDAALERCTPLAGMEPTKLGPVTLRGRETPIGVLGLPPYFTSTP
ncbi:adenylate/guanylate cyclase domain-containing protein [Niveispirillum sp. KHB5.9]|uniref:adenylate/guanylate cyclase domain-containing protein n=1 Tax=Niveispirillum sp. KHB5.9 TaxID=3400269 RepID=UPI003A8858C8